MKKLTILSVLIISFSFCSAQYSTAMHTTDSHLHKGFFLSLSAGPNFSGITTKANGQTDTNYNGSGPVMDFKIGRAVKENLILHATLTTNYMSGPKISSNDGSQKASDNFMIGEDFIGGGITYYIIPSNMLLSGSIGLVILG